MSSFSWKILMSYGWYDETNHVDPFITKDYLVSFLYLVFFYITGVISKTLSVVIAHIKLCIVRNAFHKSVLLEMCSTNLIYFYSLTDLKINSIKGNLSGFILLYTGSRCKQF